MTFHGWKLGSDAPAVLEALSKSLAIIAFKPDGTILAANENFCQVMGYRSDEIVGKHHSLFVEPHYAASQDYKDFWTKLGRGAFDAREFKRIGKGGKEVWIQASYNPVVGSNGKVRKVVKLATDITAEKLKAAEIASKLEPIMREQAVIEFTLDGEILTANENFLKTVGYRLEDIQGRHHRIFVEPSYAQSADYHDFWRQLRDGRIIAGEFKRVAKSGDNFWIQASYNPILDMNGKPTKIVKFAIDITPRIRAVEEIGIKLAGLAEGDLEKEITRAFPTELEQLRLDYNHSVAKLRPVLETVRQTAQGIHRSTQEIQTSSDSLSKRTEQQAASLEETAAALDEITATVRKTANNAAHARAVVETAKSDAAQSGRVVREAVNAMTGIEKSSRQISQIIGVIDEIAFQTNLLALNAGVEAARAGDAGRGFAVVASEVRALAQRSAEAAKEIKTLIASSTNQVEDGAKAVGDAGQVLERIASHITSINTIMSEIAASAQEQAIGLEQVNIAIGQMDQVTQHNAAMVEEMTAATQSLAQETEDLFHAVAPFKTGGRHLEAVAVPAAPRRIPGGTPMPKRAVALRVIGQRQEHPQMDGGWQDF